MGGASYPRASSTEAHEGRYVHLVRIVRASSTALFGVLPSQVACRGTPLYKYLYFSCICRRSWSVDCVVCRCLVVDSSVLFYEGVVAGVCQYTGPVAVGLLGFGSFVGCFSVAGLWRV